MNQYQKRGEVKTMKYETPELVALTEVAINAIQTKPGQPSIEGLAKDVTAAYEDWE